MRHIINWTKPFWTDVLLYKNSQAIRTVNDIFVL